MASLIAHTAAGSTDSNGFTTGGIDTSGAVFLIAVVVDYLLATQATLSDSKGNTWTALTTHSETVSGARLRVFYAANAVVGTGHTFTVTSTTGYPSIAVQAWSGIQTSSPFDTENGNDLLSSASIQPGSVTPARSNELCITGVVLSAPVSGTLAIDSGFTVSDAVEYLVSNHFGAGFAYFVQSAGSTLNPTWSWTGSQGVAAVIALFFSDTLPGDEGFAWYQGSRQ